MELFGVHRSIASMPKPTLVGGSRTSANCVVVLKVKTDNDARATLDMLDRLITERMRTDI